MTFKEKLKLEQNKHALAQARDKQSVISFLDTLVPEANFFLSLTTSDARSPYEMSEAARRFHHSVSIAIAGKDAKNNRYVHPIAFVIENRDNENPHLHCLMNALPSNYSRVTSNDDLRMKCSEIWSDLRFKKSRTIKKIDFATYKEKLQKRKLLARKKLPFHNKEFLPFDEQCALIAIEHSPDFFIDIMHRNDLSKAAYMSKTFETVNSDFFIPTY